MCFYIIALFNVDPVDDNQRLSCVSSGRYIFTPSIRFFKTLRHIIALLTKSRTTSDSPASQLFHINHRKHNDRFLYCHPITKAPSVGYYILSFVTLHPAFNMSFKWQIVNITLLVFYPRNFNCLVLILNISVPFLLIFRKILCFVRISRNSHHPSVNLHFSSLLLLHFSLP